MKLFTVQEIAGLFQVTDTTVYQWMREGSITYIRLGKVRGRIRFTQQALDEFMKLYVAKTADTVALQK